MGVRLLAAGVASLAVVAVTAAGLYLRAEPSAPELPEPAPAESEPDESWRVLGATSAHRVLVVEVETAHPEDAAEIAVQIVEPVRSRDYEEILIYIHREGDATGTAVRRVQWTPGGGYVEVAYGAER